MPPARRPDQNTTPETTSVIARTLQHWVGSKETLQRKAPAFSWCFWAEIRNDLNRAVRRVLMGTHSRGTFDRFSCHPFKHSQLYNDFDSLAARRRVRTAYLWALE